MTLIFCVPFDPGVWYINRWIKIRVNVKKEVAVGTYSFSVCAQWR